jgi:hypothetical protein
MFYVLVLSLLLMSVVPLLFSPMRGQTNQTMYVYAGWVKHVKYGWGWRVVLAQTGTAVPVVRENNSGFLSPLHTLSFAQLAALGRPLLRNYPGTACNSCPTASVIPRRTPYPTLGWRKWGRLGKACIDEGRNWGI